MTEKDINSILSKGESSTIEFKSSFNAEVIETLVAFSNTLGGSVLIGISKDSKLIGVSINSESIQSWLNEIKSKTTPSIMPDAEVVNIGLKKIVVFSVQEFPIKPVALKGKYYKRVANSNHALSTQEVVNLHLRSFNTSWDYHTNNQFSIKDISFEKVQQSIDRLNQIGGHITDNPLSFLIKCDLVREGLVTNAAYLMFKKEDSVLTTIELGRFQTEIIIKDSARTKTDILTQIEQVIDFVRKHINKEIIITGEAQNTQKWQYPLEAIREIVMNMIIHRDYHLASDSLVKVFNNKIEFYNPGRLPDNITIEDLLSNNYKSTPRNKLIADFCKSLGLIEKYGSGIRRIVDYFKAENLPTPEFRNISDGFMVTVMGKDIDKVTKDVTENVTKDVTENVTENRIVIILNEINLNNKISIDQLAKILKVTRRTIIRDLELLKKQYVIKRIGPDKGGHWEVIGKAK
jgi:ATP-dependent DNA helicase RecG